MSPKVEIDDKSGFCFGVVRAIRSAEEELADSDSLYCLGHIVHNSKEVERLQKKGLKTITHAEMQDLKNAKVLLRAHGEPPSTYQLAKKNNIEIIDATCPVVLELQRRIKRDFKAINDSNTLILIYGQRGHAEVNGLVGQTDGEAIVIEDESELDNIDLNRNIILYSQTTKSLNGFQSIIEAIRKRKTTGEFTYYDTICRQVANRMSNLRKFATTHEVIIFVCGRESSNGKVLFHACRDTNPRTYMVANESELNPQWYADAATIGICGATSTPSWLMNNIKDKISGKE
jgi:4-hydroxy-3-methylbut-2-enyl diphosphate reductase